MAPGDTELLDKRIGEAIMAMIAADGSPHFEVRKKEVEDLYSQAPPDEDGSKHLEMYRQQLVKYAREHPVDL